MTYRTSAPTPPAAPPPAEIQERRTLLEPTVFSVAANSLRAIFAGLGVALIVACVLWWLGFNATPTATHFLRVWGITAGVLLFVLHSGDRIAFVISQWNLHNTRVDLEAAEDEIETLQAEVATVRHENGILAWRIQEAERNRNFLPATAPETAAYRDARELIKVWAQTGEHPARRKLGWTESRHSAAMYILESRQIVSKGRGNVITWQAIDAPTALTMLASKQLLLGDDDASQVATQSD